MGGEENYFQVNSPHCDRQFGLQTDPKCCRCKLQPSPLFSFLSHPPSIHPSLPPPARSGKTLWRAVGAQCQMCQVIPADRLRIKEYGVQEGGCVCVCALEQVGGWKKEIHKSRCSHSSTFFLSYSAQLKKSFSKISLIAIKGAQLQFQEQTLPLRLTAHSSYFPSH